MPEQGYDYFTNGETGETLCVRRATGEVSTGIIITVPEGTYFKTPEQQEADRRRKEGLQKKLEQDAARKEKNTNLKDLGKYFFAVHTDFSELSDAALARLIYLTTFLTLDDGQLFRTQRTPMTEADLTEEMKLSQSTVERFMKEAHDYIQADCNGNLHIMSGAFHRGHLPKGQHIPIQRLYRDAIRRLYRTTPTSKHRYLGMIFRLLPYINQEYNVLCWNPEEDSIDDMDLMSLAEFCELVGYKYAKFWKLRSELKKLTFDVDGKREMFCSFVDAGIGAGRIQIFINPHILYNGTDYKKVEILGKFCEL